MYAHEKWKTDRQRGGQIVCTVRTRHIYNLYTLCTVRKKDGSSFEIRPFQLLFQYYCGHLGMGFVFSNM